jgi:hypothetical protein
MLGSDPDSLIQVSAFYELVRSFAFYNSVTSTFYYTVNMSHN